MSESKDECLDLDQLRHGEAEAFARLVDRHQAMVLCLGQTMGWAGADLDDAAAEVFTAVYRALPRFEGRSQVRTWIYRIALRTYSKLRGRRLRFRCERPCGDELAADQVPPGWNLERNEAYERLWAAVAALEPRQAAAIEMHYRQGWPLSEVAKALECPVATVKTLLFRARQQLRQMLVEQEIRL